MQTILNTLEIPVQSDDVKNETLKNKEIEGSPNYVVTPSWVYFISWSKLF